MKNCRGKGEYMNKRIKKKKSTVISVFYKNYVISQSLYTKELFVLDLDTFYIIGIEKLKKRISKNKMITRAIYYEQMREWVENHFTDAGKYETINIMSYISKIIEEGKVHFILENEIGE